MARKFNGVWQKKARCLGVLTIFKQALKNIVNISMLLEGYW